MRSFHCVTTGLAASLQHQDTGSILAGHSGLKYLALLQVGNRLQLWLGPDPWPGNSLCHRWPKKKKKMVTVDILVLFFIFEEMLLLFSIKNDVSCGFVTDGLYYVEVYSLHAHFLQSFYHKWVLILSKPFSASIKMIIWFLFFSFLMWYITLIDLWTLKNPASLG